MAQPITKLLQDLFKEAESIARRAILLKAKSANPAFQKHYGERIDKFDKAMSARLMAFALTTPVEKATLVPSAEQECCPATTAGRILPKDVVILLSVMEKLLETCTFSIGQQEAPLNVCG